MILACFVRLQIEWNDPHRVFDRQYNATPVFKRLFGGVPTDARMREAELTMRRALSELHE